MQEKYKFMFLRKIYKELNLNEIEIELLNNGIKTILHDEDNKTNNLWMNMTSYFSLENNVYENQLPEELKEKYRFYFSLPLEQLCSNEMEIEVYNFLNQTYKLLLFPNIDENHVFYGPLDYNYIAPRDAIVLGFNYSEFEIIEDNFDEIHNKNDSLICDTLNYIQRQLAAQHKLKIAVIKYNEFLLPTKNHLK